jgi:hypothetical protein
MRTLLVILTITAQAFAGSIIGTVRSLQTGKPLAGIAVTVDTLGKTVLSDAAGAYRIDSIAPGSYNLSFSGNDFEPLRQNDVFVSGDAPVRVDVDLAAGVVSLDKMVVRGTAFKRPSDMAGSTKIMTFDEILRSPGALVDIQRAVQNLPSVTSAADNTNEIIVRGGAPGENELLMDNIEVPNANQFAEQGTGGGVVSLINPLLVKGLTFNAGAPPAQYGGKASSVLDVKLRDGNDKLVVGGVDLGIAGIGGHIEGPLWKGATFMASATKSYLDFVAQFDPTTAVPKYWGGQAKVTQHIGSGTLTLNGIYGDNSIEIDSARKNLGLKDDVIKSGGRVYVTGGTFESFLTDRLSTSVTLSAVGNGFDRLTYTDTLINGVPSQDSSFVNRSFEQEQTVKGSLSLDFGERDRVTIGGFGRRCDADIRLWSAADTLRVYTAVDTSIALGPDSQSLINSENVDRRLLTYKYGGFISSTLFFGDKLRLVPGLRFDGLTYTNNITVSPRLNAVYTVTPALNLTAATGIQYQDPDYVSLVSSANGQSLKPKRAITGIGGMEYTWTGPQVQTIVEGFYKRYDNMPVDSSLLVTDGFTHSNTVLSIGEGQSYGVELFAQKKLTNAFSGSAAYSLSKSQYRDPRPGHGNAWYDGDYDFGNSITVTGGWKKELLGYEWYRSIHDKLWFILLSPIMPISDRLELSAKWQFVGGRPYNEPTYEPQYQRWMNEYSLLNTKRYPAYHTLDIRFERRFGFGFLQMIYYFDLKNVYAHNNVWSYVYPDHSNTPKEIRQLPFFPAGGMIIGF